MMWDGMGGVGLGQEDGSLVGGVGGNGQGGSGGQVGVLVDAEGLAVIAGVAAAMKRQKIVGGAKMNSVQ